jgi:thymidylate synthase (FAD)
MSKILLYEEVGDTIGSVELVETMGSDLTVVNAARVSFGAHKDELDEKDIKLIKYLAEHRHTSPFEHCSVTFRCHVPLFVRSQHHRHRTWKYNEVSRRYTSENLEFYEPTLFRPQHKSNRQASVDAPQRVWISDGRGDAHEAIVAHHRASLELFERLLEAGVSREQARGVLPQNLYTTYYATVDLSNLSKFYSLRTHDGAQWEIRKLAEGMAELVKPIFPHAWSALLDRANKDNGEHKE